MFGSKKNVRKQIDSLIGKQTEITGNIDFCGGLLIDGKVTGNITSHNDETATLSISEHGNVTGEVKVPNVVVNGMVEGDVYASNHVELAKNAHIIGNVYYNLFEMAMGAEVNGNLVHVTEDKPSSKTDEKSNMEANFKT